MEYLYKPFIISTEFDNEPTRIDSHRWIAGAVVDIGDLNGPRYKDTRGKFARWADNRLFGTQAHADERSFNCIFTFFVCSKEFRDNPTVEYEKYSDIMLIQDAYDPIKAEAWLRHRLDSIGDVNENELGNQLRSFLETEEFDFEG